MPNTRARRPRRIHVVINPMAGQPKPVLHTLARVFNACDVAWDVSVTHEPGDATREAAKAAEQRADVVAVYGGDDTVLDVASGLMGTRVPMAILPGGTLNTRAKEFGAPLRLDAAARIACDPNSRAVPFDMGECNARAFMRHVQVGLNSEQLDAGRNVSSKRNGKFAYAFAMLKALHDSKSARFRLTLDGQPMECDGVLCHVANVVAAGELGSLLSPEATASDGLLDIVVLQASDFTSLMKAVEGRTGVSRTALSLRQWRAREVSISAGRALPAECDGAPHGTTPLTIRAVPNAIRVLVKA